MSIFNTIKCKLFGHLKVKVNEDGIMGVVVDSKCNRCGMIFFKTPSTWLIDRYHSDKFWNKK